MQFIEYIDEIELMGEEKADNFPVVIDEIGLFGEVKSDNVFEGIDEIGSDAGNQRRRESRNSYPGNRLLHGCGF